MLDSILEFIETAPRWVVVAIPSVVCIAVLIGGLFLFGRLGSVKGRRRR